MGFGLVSLVMRLRLGFVVNADASSSDQSDTPGDTSDGAVAAISGELADTLGERAAAPLAFGSAVFLGDLFS